MRWRFGADAINRAHRANHENLFSEKWLPARPAKSVSDGGVKLPSVHRAKFRFSVNPIHKPRHGVASFVDWKVLHEDGRLGYVVAELVTGACAHRRLFLTFARSASAFNSFLRWSFLSALVCNSSS
jgi:hypothetical protein